MKNIFNLMTLLAQEKSSVNLSQGLPINFFDDQWLDYIKNEENCNWQYMPINGTKRLNDEIKKDYGIGFESLITSGCTESLLCSLYSIKQLGFQSIIVPEPYYSYYPSMCSIVGIELISSTMCEAYESFELDIVSISSVLNNTTAILLNSPHNPTGMVIPEYVWTELINTCKENGSFILIDDVYRHFNYTNDSTPYDDLLRISERVLISGSISKSFAASGLRVGWLLGSEKNLEIANYYHMHMSNCSAEIVQKAASKMIAYTQLESVSKYYEENRDILYAALQKAGFDAYYPRGGHFIVACLANINTTMSAEEFCVFLTENYGVTPLPLDTFYASESKKIRFSFSISRAELSLACKRLELFTIGELDG